VGRDETDGEKRLIIEVVYGHQLHEECILDMEEWDIDDYFLLN
jgi:hypothetical protein